jgi:hypothetical protein
VVASANVRHFRQIDDHFSLPGLLDPFYQAWPIPVAPS